MRKRIVFGTLSMLLIINILTLPLVDAGTKTDSSPTYGVYDRLAAYNYAQKYWDEVCSDGYFVNTRTTFIPLDPGTDITGMTGYDCAHFVSCCIGNEPHEHGGGLDVPRTAPHIYGELGATMLGDWLISSGNGVEKTAISELMMGDIINYDWDGDGHWDHAALYLGDSEVAGHTTSVWEADWQLIGAANYRFIHIPSTPWIVDDDGSADFQTIQEAINVASDGDTIFVRNGTYYEHVMVNKTISLIGERRETTIIDGSGYGNVGCVMANNIVIQSFTFQNGEIGLCIDNGSNNSVSRNKMSYNNKGIQLIGRSSWYNIIEDNILSNNNEGLALNPNYNNITIYHNNLINNAQQVSSSNFTNIWDNGCEGNYWSNYNGTDLDGNGIGDTFLPWESVDQYPLMNSYWLPGDVNHDLKIDIYDVVRITEVYGSQQGDPNWNCHSDIAEPYGIINIYDVVTCTKDYGKEYTP